MSIKKIYCNSAKLAFKHLDSLLDNGSNEILFRGQQNSNWNLQTSLARYSIIPHESWSSDIDMLISKFRTSLIKLGDMPDIGESRSSWIEYAQHYGIPTPCLDFTYSPYVALFFAFNGIRSIDISNKRDKYVVVYALNISQLSSGWADFLCTLNNDKSRFSEFYNEFLGFDENYFQSFYPGNKLKFINYPSKYNSRMQRQQGAFIYDTLDYSQLSMTNLEDFIENIVERDVLCNGTLEKGKPTLTKIYISKQCVTEVFQRLELMNINGTMLYLSSEGCAMDVKNTYYYNPRSMYLRDIDFPTPEDTQR